MKGSLYRINNFFLFNLVNQVFLLLFYFNKLYFIKIAGLSVLESMSMYSYLSSVAIKNISRDLSGYYGCQVADLYNINISKTFVHIHVNGRSFSWWNSIHSSNNKSFNVRPCPDVKGGT